MPKFRKAGCTNLPSRFAMEIWKGISEQERPFTLRKIWSILLFAFDEGERTLIEKNSSFYGLYDVGNLAPPENFSGANDVSAMPCASAPRASLSLRVSCRTHSTNR